VQLVSSAETRSTALHIAAQLPDGRANALAVLAQAAMIIEDLYSRTEGSGYQSGRAQPQPQPQPGPAGLYYLPLPQPGKPNLRAISGDPNVPR
jgi:hypothetical protein